MKKASSISIAFLIILSLTANPTMAEMYESSKLCRGCHMEIYRQWLKSGHSESFTDPLFRECLQGVVQRSSGQGGQCFFCHSPTATVPESSLRACQTVREGVTCDFCHTVKAARISEGFPRYLNAPGAKRGPMQGEMSMHHPMYRSPLILESKLCAGCHEFTNRHGVGILTTGTEWKRSVYGANGTTCQECHLPRDSEDIGLLMKQVSYQGPPNHRMREPTGTGRLKDAFTLMGYLFIKRQRAYVEVELSNEKGGHMLPTGMPSHRIVLVTKLVGETGNLLGLRELYFERVLGDERGNVLRYPDEMISRGEKVLRDSRIGPKETRTLGLVFPLLTKQENLYAELQLLYELPSRFHPMVRERLPIYSITIPYHIWNVPWEIIIFLSILAASTIVAYRVFRPAGGKLKR